MNRPTPAENVQRTFRYIRYTTACVTHGYRLVCVFNVECIAGSYKWGFVYHWKGCKSRRSERCWRWRGLAALNDSTAHLDQSSADTRGIRTRCCEPASLRQPPRWITQTSEVPPTGATWMTSPPFSTTTPGHRTTLISRLIRTTTAMQGIIWQQQRPILILRSALRLLKTVRIIN